eukprot:UN24174
MGMLTALLTPTSGECFLKGSSNPVQMRAILGSCPQHDPLWAKFTVRQYLTFFGLVKGVPFWDLKAEVEKLCVALTLDPYFDRASGTLSGGNKRKLVLASALIGASEVVFLDEPSSGVDPFARSCMMEVIQKFNEDRAIVLTTHMMEEADVLCDRIGIMVNSGTGGDFKVCNTINGLVNQLSSGYQIEISLSGMKKETVEEIKTYIT